MRTVEEIDAEIKSVNEELANVRGGETEVYARIVGYYRSVRNWNRGKREEYGKRKVFALEESEGRGSNSAAQDLDESLFDAANFVEYTSSSVVPVEGFSESDIAYYELFSRKTCPNCPPVKSFMADLNLAGTEFDVDAEAGFSRASELGVMASPTVVFFDANGIEISRASNVSELRKFFSRKTAKIA